MPEPDNDRLGAYIRDLFVPDDQALQETVRKTREAGLPAIQVPPELGKLLGILIRASGARRVLEIGTLGGYSAIWMGRALPDGGRLISLEADAHHAEVARANVERAGLGECVEIRVGNALETLPALAEGDKFDLIFIDADKGSYPAYLDWALRLARPGGLIVADNVLSHSSAMNPDDPAAPAIDRFNRTVASDPMLDAIILPNRNGRDGVLIAVLRDMTP